ncbi:MAG: xanthine dehydrogenase family protein molybdopterin-binding subunit, partial [Paracoccaceae bacterium]
MDKFGKSQSVTRVEDIRFLTGQGRYIDDISPEGALRLVVVRSSVAHARIIAIDTEAARAVPGVHLVVTGADLNAAGVTYGMGYSVLKNRDGSQAAAPKRPILTTDKIRFVGEALAFVVADTLHAAQEAAELVDIDYDELPAHMDQAPLRTPGTDPIHAEAPDNRVFDWAIGDAAATDAAFAKAARVVTLDVDDNRVIINAMEPRGAFAEWDGARLHVAFGGQGVWGLKGELKACFGLDDDAVRVTNPDVGGGFGMKAMNYPEYFMVAHAARALGRPVRWMSERTEAML